MTNNEKIVYVYENWISDEPHLMGKLYSSFIRGEENFAFEYDLNWIKEFNFDKTIDPDLTFMRGRQYTSDGKTLFGIFADSCPDRWGRVLMNRKEEFIAKKENRKPRKLSEIDYLLGVNDKSRMGALRFSLEENGEFVSNDEEFSTPPWVNLRELEQTSINYENDNNEGDKWIKQLVAPGSSLGGARPKANVIAPDGSLWIAKFPSKYDELNAGCWEKVANDLAKMCELDVPESKIESFSKYGSTFLVKRFDRENNKRIHFASAMTLLGKKDGVSSHDDVSYLDLVDFIRSFSCNPDRDLKELWKRVAFNIAISNTDDHLRNHGFILCNNGWMLSPVYDINPTPWGNNLSLNIDENSSELSFDLLMSVSYLYGLDDNYAKTTIKHICEIVCNNWENTARQYHIPNSEIERMKPAFIKAQEFYSFNK